MGGVYAVSLTALTRHSNAETHTMNIQKIISDGGTTISLQGETPKRFLVSFPFFETIHRHLSESIVHEYISKHLPYLLKDNCYLGIWKHGEVWYIDISTSFETLETASEVGVSFSQKAIFDTLLNKQIDL